MQQHHIALVLQGGGALGAYEYGEIKALYEQPHFSPDIISGVSIGAFSAAVLVGVKDDPVDGLQQLWHCFTAQDMPFVPQPIQLMMILPFNKGMYQPNPYALVNPAMATHFCQTGRLYTTLKKIIDLDKLNDPQSPHLMMTATNVKTGKLEKFDNHETKIIYEHIVASGSLPPCFPMTTVDGNHYWDDGLFSNTPLKSAFKALEKLGDIHSQREIILVELFPNDGKQPNDMVVVFERMIGLMFESKMQFDKGMHERTNSYIDMVHMLDKELPANSPIRQLTPFKKTHAIQQNSPTLCDQEHPALTPVCHS